MRIDYRPYTLKKVYLRFQKFYTLHFLKPQLEFLGHGFMFMRPWNIKLFGGPISIGEYATIIASANNKIHFTIWPRFGDTGSIKIGKFCIISPGVRISSAFRVNISDSCMIASNVYITDSDWHGVYNRTSFGKSIPINLEKNVWIGDSAIICKGVNIGCNSIVGAGAVVTESVPKNVIVAGNPAKVIKKLDYNRIFISRKHYFSNPKKLVKEFRDWELINSRGNTFLNWLIHFICPSKGD